MRIETSEFRYVEDLLFAATTGDWLKFKSLVQEPFSNESTMRENFENASRLLQRWGDQSQISISGFLDPTGYRIIDIEICSADSQEMPISLLLKNSPRIGQNIFSVVSFYQNIDMTSFYE